MKSRCPSSSWIYSAPFSRPRRRADRSGALMALLLEHGPHRLKVSRRFLQIRIEANGLLVAPGGLLQAALGHVEVRERGVGHCEVRIEADRLLEPRLGLVQLPPLLEDLAEAVAGRCEIGRDAKG